MLDQLAPPLGFALTLFSVTCFLAGCLSKSLTSLQVVPAAGGATAAVGQTSQFQALAVYTESGHATTTQDMTQQATWQSSTPAIATINSTGLATGVSPGTGPISATLQGAFGTVVGTSNITVTAAAAGGAAGNLSSLAIIPTAQGVTTLNETGQFIAIGTLVTGASEDLTNQISWISSDVKVATINPSGLVTGLNPGMTTITGIATVSGSAVTTATAIFTVGPITGTGTQLPTLTVYKVGNNATGGNVVGSVLSAGVIGPQVIDCGSGSGCIGNFPVGSQVILTATPAKNSVFGGWSSNCVPYPNNSAAPSNMCMVTVNDNDTVGAIFN
jgi:Bacterial Ig-like domain (group 2)/Divergent InlB B-repeat domain